MKNSVSPLSWSPPLLVSPSPGLPVSWSLALVLLILLPSVVSGEEDLGSSERFSEVLLLLTLGLWFVSGGIS